MTNAVLALMTPKMDTLMSPLSSQDCADRLREGVDGNLMIFGSKPFIARITEAQPVADGLMGQTGRRRTVNIIE